MNSIHRVGVTVAGLATVVAIAGAFVVQGYAGAQHTVAQATVQTTASATIDPTLDPTPSVAPQTIYVNPMPTPAVIHVVTKPKPAPPAKKPPVIHVVVPGPTGGDDGGGDN
jgi:hypothetical protein